MNRRRFGIMQMTEPERLINLARDCALLRQQGRFGPEIQRELRRMEMRFKVRSWAMELHAMKGDKVEP